MERTSSSATGEPSSPSTSPEPSATLRASAGRGWTSIRPRRTVAPDSSAISAAAWSSTSGSTVRSTPRSKR